ncbi:cytochrome b561 domain-containing protein [Aureimonas leprariae]|uniref:Cytochrome B n=1 Tax=Plantimonas leprariae TaxID=2615207 RepID=A0A7V7PN41_9HYPH|nr:cytochrome b561 domain-containing protein [Aureimonas leprariae]KAB0679007.1 cytochrome B [Aureimonas leprariae]
MARTTDAQFSDLATVGGRAPNAPAPLERPVGSRSIWLVPAAAVAAALAVWFGLSGTVGAVLALHAACMLSAWGILLPAGGLIARFAKVTSRQDFPREIENLYWWVWHRRLQYAGSVVATLGFVAVVSQTGGRFDTVHGRVGLAVLLLGWSQVGSAWLRGTKGGPTGRKADPRDPATWRGDHYDMTARRRRFEAWHRPAGWAALGAGLLTIVLGVDLVGTPAWLFAVAAVAEGAVVLAFLDGTFRSKRTDTYASIWGPRR